MKELMNLIAVIEKKCDEANQKLPPLPKEFIDFVVKIAPYLAIGVMGIIPLFSVFTLFASLSLLSLSMTFALISMVMIVILAGNIFCAIKSIPGLFAQTRSGWNWIFYSELISAVGIVLTFNIYGVLWFALWLYILFQIKASYPEKKLEIPSILK